MSHARVIIIARSPQAGSDGKLGFFVEFSPIIMVLDIILERISLLINPL